MSSQSLSGRGYLDRIIEDSRRGLPTAESDTAPMVFDMEWEAGSQIPESSMGGNPEPDGGNGASASPGKFISNLENRGPESREQSIPQGSPARDMSGTPERAESTTNVSAPVGAPIRLDNGGDVAPRLDNGDDSFDRQTHRDQVEGVVQENNAVRQSRPSLSVDSTSISPGKPPVDSLGVAESPAARGNDLLAGQLSRVQINTRELPEAAATQSSWLSPPARSGVVQTQPNNAARDHSLEQSLESGVETESVSGKQGAQASILPTPAPSRRKTYSFGKPPSPQRQAADKPALHIGEVRVRVIDETPSKTARGGGSAGGRGRSDRSGNTGSTGATESAVATAESRTFLRTL